MKKIKLLLLVQFIALCVFGQDKTLSPNIQSRQINETGQVKNLTFKEQQRPLLREASQVLQDYLGASENISFSKVKSEIGKLGLQHEKFQQYYQSVPVEFGIYKVHANAGNIYSINGEFYALENLVTTPSFSKSAAISKAKQYVNAAVYLEKTDEHDHDAHDIGFDGPNPQLVIFPQIEGINKVARLAYKLDIYAEKPLYRADVYLDAATGEVIFENNKIHHADIAASGTSLYNGTVNFTADQNGSTYRLRQTANGNGIETYDMNNGTSYSNASDVTSNSTSFTNSATAVQAHWGAENTHSYYQQKHGRNSYNGNGAVIKSYVSYSTNYVNAFWNGSVMTYGDGNGTSYSPLVPLDIVGHEITHGVVSNSANLVYNAESGALNESFADIFGEMVENHAQGNNDWMMGTEIGIGQSGAFRSMNDPKLKGDPDTYNGQYWHTSSSDNYGVHTNSGVQNKWFYILSIGESGTNDNNDNYSVSGLGITKAGQIAYRNLTVYLSANSNYAAARAGAIQSAVDLFGPGSPEEIATTDAWYAVGVGNAWGPPPPPAPCVDGNVTLTILLDNYPSETSWDIRNTSNAVVASGSGYSGQGSTVTANATLAAGNYTFTIYDSYGDGICCAYGTGNYVLQSDTLIASGGAFGSSETTSFCVSAAGPDVTPPSNPTNLSSANTTQTTTDLSWTASTDNVGVSGYNVYQNSSLIGTTATTNFSVTALMASTSYSFTVEAYDAATNVSGLSNVETVTTLASPDVTPPSNPTSLTSANTTQNSTDLSWTASTDNIGVAGYNVYQGGSLIGTTASTNYSVTGLSPSTTYNFTIEAFDAANNVSGLSNVESVTTNAFVDIVPPTSPTNLTSSNVTTSSGDLNWASSSDNVAVQGYNVYVNGVVVGTVPGTNYVVTGLSSNTTYNCTVEAFDAANNVSGLSNVETFTTLPVPDATPPSNPTNLSSANTTQTTTDLNWTASTDNVGVTGYNVYQGGSLIGTTAGTSYAVTGLTASTTYNYTVEAFDAANNVSGLSNVETLTTLNNTSSTTVLHQGFFETGWDGWQDGGSDCYRYSGSRSWEGSKSIRIRDNSGTKSAMTSPTFDLTPYDNVEVSFYFYPRSMENGEDFWLRYYDGTSWSTVAAYARGTSFNNNVFYTATVTLPSTAVNFATNSQFRFQCDASGNNDQIYIDQVEIKGIIGTGGSTQIAALGSAGIIESEMAEQEDGIYPNPVVNQLTFNGADANDAYRILDMSGKLILRGHFSNAMTIDVSGLSTGVYFLSITDEEETEQYKFIKQ